ncbi:MAG: YdcF family protein [Acidobacteriota bacterium]
MAPADKVRKNKRLILGVRLAAAFLVVWLPISWIAASALVVNVRLERADAVVVLSGSSTYIERARWAALIFNQGRAPKIILTNDKLQSGYSLSQDRNPFFVELAVDELRRSGVPADRIEVIPTPARNTHDEAILLRDYSTQHDLQALSIVTSPYHTRRASRTFGRAFQGTSTRLGVESPPPGLQSPLPATWWLHPLGWKLVPGEYLKLIYYAWRY